MKIPEKIPGLSYLREISWDEIIENWRASEEHLEHWIKIWQKRGLSSWQEWRQRHFDYLELGKVANWYLYKIDNPPESVPSFLGGPFPTWYRKYYKNDYFPSFSEIVENPNIQNDQRINTIINNFPKKTFLVGSFTKNGIVILEGMHRCCALTLAEKKGVKIKTSAVIALSQGLVEELWRMLLLRTKYEDEQKESR